MGVLAAIAVMALLEPSLTHPVILLALPVWMGYARTVRSLAPGLKRRELVEAAPALGAPGPLTLPPDTAGCVGVEPFVKLEG